MLSPVDRVAYVLIASSGRRSAAMVFLERIQVGLPRGGHAEVLGAACRITVMIQTTSGGRASNGVVALSPEDRLHLLLGRLVHAVARLDFSVGLQLRWLGPYRGHDVADLLSTGQGSFHQRLRKLRSLAAETWAQADAEALKSFSDWFVRAEAARGIRNDYAHGRWGRRSFRSDDFNFIALSWEMDPDKQPPEVVVHLDELAREVAEIESLAHEFFELQKQFEGSARPSIEWEIAHRDKVSPGGPNDHVAHPSEGGRSISALSKDRGQPEVDHPPRLHGGRDGA